MDINKQLPLPLFTESQLHLFADDAEKEKDGSMKKDDAFFNKREEDDADYPDDLRKKSEEKDIDPDDENIFDEDEFYTR